MLLSGLGCGCSSRNDVRRWEVESGPNPTADSRWEGGGQQRVGAIREIKVVKVDSVFESDLFERLSVFVKTIGWEYGWRSNQNMGFGHWNYDFAKVVKENGEDVSSKISGVLLEAWEFLKENRFPNSVLLRCYANAHTYGIEGYPHTDSIRDCDETVVIYMNKVWKREWGGETIIYGDNDNNSIVHAELPSQNRAIIFPGRVWHVARSVTRICPELRVTLIFKLAPKNVDPLRDQVQRLLMDLKCHEIKHSGGLLIGHLLRCYDLLKNKNADSDLCAAAGLHSVFGTCIFKERALAIDEKQRVSQVVGEACTELVIQFSRINSRPASLERFLAMAAVGTEAVAEEYTIPCTGTGPDGNQPEMLVSGKNMQRLCAIEAANLIDQRALGAHKNLEKFWRRFPN